MDKAGSDGSDGGSGEKGGKGGSKNSSNSEESDDDEGDDESDKDGDEEDDEDLEEDDEDEEEEAADKKKVKIGKAEMKNAKNLYLLLKDPESAPKVIEVMAKRAGLLKDIEDKSNKEIKKDAKSIVDIFKEHLGEKYEFLADKLGPAIEAVLKAQREEFEESLSSVKRSQIDNQTESALNKLSKETNGNSRKFEQKMAQMADKIKPADGISTYEYCRILYEAVSGSSNAQSASKKIADKLKKNASDVGSRINGSSSKGNLRNPNKTMESREAAQHAFDKIMSNVDDD